ncbi:MAG: DUF4070 domain-containing protein [Candidatus Aminicenantes bacterium]|nr:MAG: DUF4070 domain-containing protein [Candidatus Aminicenantes bacterium]
MKVLLIYPKYPETFWSFKYALKFISKKAAFPPLGLLTVAAMLPREWEKKLVDMNATHLTDAHLDWADLVFISAMATQKKSTLETIQKCKSKGLKVVAGGPLFTTQSSEFDSVDHLVLNEAEETLADLLKDLENQCARHIYRHQNWPDIQKSPCPDWQLINMNRYESMSIQYSRGCPFNCEFCDVRVLNGKKTRRKSKDQVLEELEAIYQKGWRGAVFFGDDNFIGNRVVLKKHLLPALVDWMNQKKHPFHFFTEVSINLADDEELMQLMARAGFDKVFVGIETPHEESLTECNKYTNKNRDLIANVKKIQNHGLEVQGGFIIGFDHDPPSIFEKQIRFIEQSGIVTAMVGLLTAVRGTRLYQRLKKENRLLSVSSGNNTDFSLNFIPKMNMETLINGYKNVLKTIYSPKYYYKRVIVFLKEFKPFLIKRKTKFPLSYLWAFFKSIWRLGIIGKERLYYWKLLFWTIWRRPRLIGQAVKFAIFGFHFRKIFGI